MTIATAQHHLWKEDFLLLSNQMKRPFLIEDIYAVGEMRLLSWSHDKSALAFYRACRYAVANKNAFKMALSREVHSKEPRLKELARGVYAPIHWEGNGKDAVYACYLRRTTGPNVRPLCYLTTNADGSLTIHDYDETSRGRHKEILGYSYTIKSIPFLRKSAKNELRKYFYTREYLFPVNLPRINLPGLLAGYEMLLSKEFDYDSLYAYLVKQDIDMDYFFEGQLSKFLTKKTKAKLKAYSKKWESL